MKNDLENIQIPILCCPVCGSRDLQGALDNSNTTYWLCKTCGDKFRQLEDILIDLKLEKRKSRVNLIKNIIFIAALLFAFCKVKISMQGIDGIIPLYVIGVIIVAELLIFMCKSSRYRKRIRMYEIEAAHTMNSRVFLEDNQ